MTFLRILYWGLSYTAGIVCLTGLALRYLQLRDLPTRKLISFLLPLGLSVVSLSMLEVFRGHPVYQAAAGCLALVGASLSVVSLPAFALLFDPTERRRRLVLAFRCVGWALALANAACFFLSSSSVAGWIAQFSTILVLGLAVFTAMSWIGRSTPRWDKRPNPVLMASLFVAFGLAFALDLLRSFIPVLGFLGRDYLFFPGFYAFLNVFLFYSHVKVWASDLREGALTFGAGTAAEAAATPQLLARFGVTEREAEVLALLVRGRTYREMADSLCLSLATIKTHVSHLYEKTGTRNKVELLNITAGRIGHSADPVPPSPESTE
jgi:DNA-binding CsgD family transcriptional regulator